MTTDGQNRLIDRFELGIDQALDRLRYFELVTRITVPIDAAGMYEFQLYANDRTLGGIRFTVNSAG